MRAFSASDDFLNSESFDEEWLRKFGGYNEHLTVLNKQNTSKKNERWWLGLDDYYKEHGVHIYSQEEAIRRLNEYRGSTW